MHFKRRRRATRKATAALRPANPKNSAPFHITAGSVRLRGSRAGDDGVSIFDGCFKVARRRWLALPHFPRLIARDFKTDEEARERISLYSNDSEFRV